MLKRFMISVVIASLAISVAAAPQCAGCSKEKEHTGKTTAVKAQKNTKKAVKKADAKTQVKDDCCHKDPFLMEANRMMAASEGKKSTGCKCEDKAIAQKAKAKAKKAAKK